MLTEREKRMVALLQRLSEWNTQMLDRHPVQVLKHIVGDAEGLLVEFGLPMVAPKPTEPASVSSEETSEPSKSPQPGGH